MINISNNELCKVFIIKYELGVAASVPLVPKRVKFLNNRLSIRSILPVAHHH